MAVNQIYWLLSVSFTHMDNEEKIQQTESWPMSFRVICVGKELSGVYRSIISMGLEGVSVQTTTMFPEPTPTDENKMVILLANGDSKLLRDIARSFYQAGVLTLIVSTVPVDNLNGVCDSMTVTNLETMVFVVKGILEPINHPGMLTYDFNDLCDTLHDTHKFKVFSAMGSNEGDRIKELVDILMVDLNDNVQKETEFVSLMLYFNKDVNPPLKMSELTPLPEFINHFPMEISAFWALSYDNEMQNDKIRLNVIVAGKNLRL